MKTKVFKTVLPAFVIIMAMGLSFASNSSTITQQGFYWDPDQGEVVEINVNCNSTSPDACEVNGNLVFAERDLINPLYKTAH